MRVFFIPVLTFITFTTLLSSASAAAEVPMSYFYKNSSISIGNNSGTSPEDTWVTNIGYNYRLTPKFTIDFGYLDMTLENALTQGHDSPSTPIDGMFGIAKYVHDVADLAEFYAAGGVNYLKVKPIQMNYLPSAETLNRSEVSPYLSVGAVIPSKINQNLDLNVELSYQNFQLSSASTMLSVGAQYRF